MTSVKDIKDRQFFTKEDDQFVGWSSTVLTPVCLLSSSDNQ